MALTPPATDLKKFFNPASVALVGATEDQRKFGGRAIFQMLEFGYKGRVYPINPKYNKLLGLDCYPGIAELPETPDHVGIVIAAERVLDTLKQCAEKGVKFVTIFTSNFSETGTEAGCKLQHEIVSFARDNGIRFMGPNCNGLINFVDGFAMVSTKAIKGPRKTAGSVGLICHSGGLGQMNVMWRAQEAGLGITYEVSCGNEADIDTMDFLRFMVDDPNTDAVMMAVETISNGKKFEAVARHAADLEKPIVILKFGRTEAGQRAAASHTGAITGSDEVQDAIFRQYGITRVTDCNELYEVAKTLRRRKWPNGNRAAALSGSGGHSVLLVDLGALAGITWPTYEKKTADGLRALLPGYAAVSTNPTDLTSALTGSPRLFQDALRIIAADEQVDFMIPVFVNPTVAAIDEVSKLADTMSKPLAVLWTGYCPENPEVTAATLVARGLPVYRDAMPCLKAVSAAMKYGEFLRRRKVAGSEPTRPPDMNAQQARELLAAASGTLTERASKEILAAYGFPVTREVMVTSADEAAQAARRIKGPVALKIESPDIPHKTEAGAIRLGVRGKKAVMAAFNEVMTAAKQFNGAARLNGVLVQEMAPKGLEVMLGMATDATFGPIVVVALGGIHVEVLRDIAYRTPPLAMADAASLLRELRAYRLFEGVRGTPARDIDALCDAIVRLSWLAHDLGDQLLELDINPLVSLEQGAGVRVVDALIVKKAAS